MDLRKFLLITIGLIAGVLLVFGLTQEPETNGTDVDNNGKNDEMVVELEVIESPGDAVLAFVPVYINGEGPYAFALDTGASRSVIDERVVDELGLERLGDAGVAAGIAGQTRAEEIRVDEWRIDDLELPTENVVTFDIGDPEIQFAGLLGSDVLSQFSAITIDYDNEEMRLRSRP